MSALELKPSSQALQVSSDLTMGGRRGEQMSRLIAALHAARAGDFTVRLPSDWDGLVGKAADAPPARVGFGTTILNLAASDVMGTSRSSFELRGFAWHLSFDLDEMPSTAEPERAKSTALRSDQGPAKVADASFVVLVVEDEPLIALQVQADLENDGHKVIGPALTLEHGLQLAETEKLDMALLDVNLRGRTSEGIAEVLMRREIPFAFASGYSDNALLGDKWRAAPRLKKPFDQLRLRRQLAELSAAQRSG